MLNYELHSGIILILALVEYLGNYRGDNREQSQTN